MRTQELLLCYVFTHSAWVFPYQEKQGKLFNFFLLLLVASTSAVASCEQKQQHMCVQFSSRLLLPVGLSREIKVQNPWHSRSRFRILVLILARDVSVRWANGVEGKRGIININMCEHEQSFHALDATLFISSVPSEDLIARSPYFSLFLHNSLLVPRVRHKDFAFDINISLSICIARLQIRINLAAYVMHKRHIRF